MVVLKRNKKDTSNDLRNAGYGFLSGLAVALGGGVKDAPYEGFEKFKFFRSPIVAAITGVAIGRMIKTSEPVVIFMLSLAGERLIVEAYKLGRTRMPAKFELGEWGQPKCCKCPTIRQAHPLMHT